jgi:hypothetical protein
VSSPITLAKNTIIIKKSAKREITEYGFSCMAFFGEGISNYKIDGDILMADMFRTENPNKHLINVK